MTNETNEQMGRSALRPEQSENQSSVRHPDDHFPKLIESAAILTLAVGWMYCIGWAFISSYYHRIGIQYESLNLSTEYYVRYGVVPVVFILVSVTFSLSKGSHKPVTIPQSLSVNGHWLVAVFVFCSLMYGVGGAMKRVALVYLALLVLAVVGFSVQKKTFARIWWHGSVYKRLFILLCMFLFMFITAALMGEVLARALLEGRGWGSEYKMSIEPKDEKLGIMKDKEFILIAYHDDLYYVIENRIPSPDNPTVIVIPKDEIKYATVYLKK